MPAYLIAEMDISDPKQYHEYAAAVPATLEQYGGRFLVRGGQAAQLEGDWQPKRMVVLEFADLDALNRWYESPEYQEVKKLREGASTLRGVAVEGV